MRQGVATMVFRAARDGYELLLLKRAVPPFLGDWFPVEGGIDAEEQPDDAVLRELREETQLEPQAVYRESTRVVPAATATVRLHIYVTFVASESVVRLNEEHSAFRWCSAADAGQLLSLPAQRAALRRIRSRFLLAPPPPAQRVHPRP